MKQKKDVIEERRKKIYLKIKENDYISIQDLSESIGVSLPTLRRDLNFLDEKGLINRKHGGAEATDSKKIIESQLEKKKDLIAKAASTLIDNDDTIFINSSGTSIKCIQYIEPSKYVSVITNNGRALNYHTLPNVKLIMTGGETRPPKSAMTGEFAQKNLEKVQANKLFLGASGFHLIEGITTANIDEVPINKIMLKNASKVILCADSSKLNHISAFKSGSINDIDILITDKDADKNIIEALELANIRCILVDVDDNSFKYSNE